MEEEILCKQNKNLYSEFLYFCHFHTCMHPKLISVCPSVTNTSLKNAQLTRSNYDEAAVSSVTKRVYLTKWD